jgi:hypothetical protein
MGLMMRGHFRDLVEGIKRELRTVSPKLPSQRRSGEA